MEAEAEAEEPCRTGEVKGLSGSKLFRSLRQERNKASASAAAAAAAAAAGAGAGAAAAAIREVRDLNHPFNAHHSSAQSLQLG